LDQQLHWRWQQTHLLGLLSFNYDDSSSRALLKLPATSLENKSQPPCCLGFWAMAEGRKQIAWNSCALIFDNADDFFPSSRA
jgi:hypothetical protein